MLSASTINTTSSGFSLSPATSTPSSQYSSGSGMKPSRNPLSDLLEAETTYLKTLKIIDSQISPLWMKQTTQAAPDFTELIKQVGNLVYVNRQFSSKLSKFTNQNNPAGQELGKTLMQWVDDLEVPYANYSRSYIPNLNERKDILASPSIDRLLKDLSYSASYDITLESLFNAPIQQLKYYLGLYNRLLESADPSKPDFKLLTNATRRLETILSLSQKPLPSKSNVAMLPPPIRTQDDSMNNMMKKKKSLIRQEDFFSYYTETGEISPLSDDDQDDFEGYGTSVKKHEDVDDELANIKPRTVKILPEVPGDNNKASVNGSSPTANNNNSSNKESSQIQMTYIQPATAKINKDVSSHNSDTGGIIGNKPVPSKQTSAESMSSSPSHVDTVRAALTPTSQRNLSPNPNESPRPISPRAVQVQQAVTPVAAMQAVPQKTNDYFSIPVTNNKPLPSSSSYKDLPSPSGSIPRTTSSPNNNNSRGTAQNIDPTSQSPSKPMNSQPPVLSRPFNPNQSHHNQGYPQQQQQQQQRPMYNQGGAPPPQQQQHGYRPQHGHQPPPQHHQQGYGQSRPHMHPNGPPHPMQSRSTGTSNNPMYQQQQQQQRPPLPQQGGNYPPQQQPRPILQQPQHHQQPRTPPPTDEQQQNGVRQVLYSNNQCEVFHWKAQSWYAVEGQCTLQVRLTFSGRSCLAVQLQPSGQLYLNAWILPSMVIGQPSPTDISVSVTMAAQQENYLLHFRHPADASNLLAILQRMHHESMTNQPPPPPMKKQHSAALLARQDTAVELRDETPSVEEVPQTLKPVFQCKGKLFVQSETSKWNPMGSTSMRISQQLPSQKMHIQVEDGKNKLISSIVRSGNVEVLTSKRITFLLTNDQDKTSMVYMIQVKDEQTGNKIAEYLKTQNQANGW